MFCSTPFSARYFQVVLPLESLVETFQGPDDGAVFADDAGHVFVEAVLVLALLDLAKDVSGIFISDRVVVVDIADIADADRDRPLPKAAIGATSPMAQAILSTA